MKRRWLRYTGHLAWMGNTRIAYIILGGNLSESNNLEDPGVRGGKIT
jgi:hypothetical protein